MKKLGDIAVAIAVLVLEPQSLYQTTCAHMTR